MAVKLIANYAKKLGLPGYSSHQFSISVETELTQVEDIAATSERLYRQLQDSVDKEMQNYGFVPPDGYGMAPETDRIPRNGAAANGHSSNGNGSNGTAGGGNGYHRAAPQSDRWNCTDGQKGLVIRLVHEHQLDKNEVEGMAQQLFGCGVTAMDKMQASQLIEDLLEKVGKKPAGEPALGKRRGGAAMIATIEPTESAPSEPNLEERVEELQKTVSASRLTLYLSCRLKFFFRYVAKLKKPKPAVLHVGHSVHATLKAWNKARWRGEILTLTQIHQEFTAAWADSEGEPVEWDGEEVAEKATAWRLLDTYIRSQPFPPKPEAVEVPVEADLKEHGLPIVRGILDLVQQGRIVDYKTSSTTPNPEKVAHTAEVQTSIYSLLYRENTGRQEKGIELHHLVKLKNPKVVVTELPPMSEHQESRVFTLMESYVEGLGRRDFVPAPGLQCVNCEFFADCKAWG